MRVIRGLTHFKRPLDGCVMTIGNFDGLHLGHQRVIDQVLYQGNALKLPVIVVIFEPQPLEYFLKDKAPPRLMRLREKVLQFSQRQIDALLILPFNAMFANKEAQFFIENLLIKQLNVKHLVIGHDFHFGKNRQGNFALLKTAGLILGFEVEDTPSYQQNQQAISSTLIRNVLRIGNLNQAKQMLGRDYSICGRIVRGDQRGRTLGFPTANIHLFRVNSPINGVFVITMTGIDNREIKGIANIGCRPTCTGETKIILEIHLFEFNQDIYGAYVEIHFKHKIRNEIHFETLAQLTQQIKHDIINAHDFFTQHS